eukprot:9238754-Alexandrium_andersonii.AAC.1
MGMDRGHSEPCIYDSQKFDLTPKHHMDNPHLTRPDQAEMRLEVEPKEHPRQIGETLGEKKVCTDNGIITTPDAKHLNNVFSLLGMDQQPSQCTCGVPGLPIIKLSEEEKPELDSEQATLFQQCVGGLAYTSEDRMDIKFAARRFAKKLSKPGAGDLG